MKSVICSVAFVACFSLSTSVFAQGRGQAGGPEAQKAVTQAKEETKSQS